MRSCLALPLLAALVLLPACRDAKVASYRVPKETPEALPPILTGAGAAPAAAPTNPGATMANTAVPTASDGLSWTAPAHWRTKTASAMRKASYTVTGEAGGEADLSITAFPGDVGGNLANVNRWRGQLELGPLSEADLGAITTHMDIGSLHVDFVEIANPTAAKPQRTLGAIIPFNGATWFVKLTGPEGLVAREKPAFLAFLNTIKASAPAAR